MKIKIIDEHQEAFIFWEEEKRKGRLKNGDILLHVDSHADMCMMDEYDESIYSIRNVKRFTENNLSLDSFILPAIARGIFSKIYFLNRSNKQDLAKQSKTRTDIESNRMRKRHVKIIELSSWKDEGKIWYRNLNKAEKKIADSRKTHKAIYKIICSLKDVPIGEEVVLDIDMDYFSCNKLIDFQYKPKLEKREVEYSKQFSISRDDYRINLGLVRIDSDNRLIGIETLNTNEKENIIYNDDPIWIDFAIREFVVGLEKIKLKSVSICRSVKSGHTTAKYSQLIEEKLLEYLGSNEKIDLRPPYNIRFRVNDKINFDQKRKHIINIKNLNEYYLEKPSDVLIWQLIQDGLSFGNVVTMLRKKFNFSRRKAAKELIKNVWYLKKERILK